MKKILLVEDDFSLGTTLHERLSKTYEVSWAQNLEKAWNLFNTHRDLDLIILDVGLPDGNGFEFAKKIKSERETLFIFLTAQADPESRLTGFELGAEEYIPKPFHLKELLIRVQHVLELHSSAKEIELRECSLNFTDMSVKYKDGKIKYPPVTDIKILQILVKSSPRVLSRDEIINEVWGIDKMPSHRTIDNTIVRLRQLLGSDGELHIRSVRGIGYQWFLNTKEEIQ